jgi:2-phosphosulfolactate phosphatase
MPNRILVHLLPDLISEEQLRGEVVVVIDVLRATTTITQALAQGANLVIPCLEVADVYAAAARLAPGSYLLGGERHGLPIEGFDLGNSPAEYTAQRVAGKTVVFTTTNGTRALLRSKHAGRVLLAGFVNVSAVVTYLSIEPQVILVCAGTHGQITREDALLAGCLVDRLASNSVRLNDQARLAWDAWRLVANKAETPEGLASQLRESQGGRDLVSLGLDGDIRDAAQIDRFAIVPEFDPASGEIVVPQS